MHCDLLPGGFGLAREGGQALSAGGGPLAFGALPACGAQGVCGVQEVGGGSAPGILGGGAGAVQAVQEFGVQPGFGNGSRQPPRPVGLAPPHTPEPRAPHRHRVPRRGARHCAEAAADVQTEQASALVL